MHEAIVTGGATGIGRAVAERLRDDGFGVTITGRRRDVLTAAATSMGVEHVRCDASDPSAIERALSSLPERVDVLVNNAGGLAAGSNDPGSSPLEQLADKWLADIRANLLTAVLMTAAVEDRLADDGRVIAIGSIAARQGAGSYGAAKSALETWAAHGSRNLGGRGITVNVVAPGFIAGTEFFGDAMSDARAARLVEATHNGRAGTPADVAAAVAYLASEGSGHVTGQVLHVNGGAHSGG